MYNGHKVIGAFIADDFYLHFDAEAIAVLKDKKSVDGLFVCNCRELSAKRLLFKLKIRVSGKKSKKRLCSDISLDLYSNTVNVYFTYADFSRCFRQNEVPIIVNELACLVGICNLFVSSVGAKIATERERNLINEIKQAEQE